MKIVKIALIILLVAIVVYLIVPVPFNNKIVGTTFYKTYPNVDGGCFNICDGKEKLVGCVGGDGAFATCTWYCVGKLTNTCGENEF